MKHILSQIFFNVSIGSVVMLKKDYSEFKKDKTTTVLPLLKYKYKPKLKKVVYINNTTFLSFSYIIEDHMGIRSEISPSSCKEVKNLPI